MIANKIVPYLKTLLTIMVVVCANMIAIYAVDYISQDFTVGPWYNAAVIIMAVAITNSLLWPIFQRFLMKIIIFTFGIATIFINCITFYIASYFIPGVYVGFYGALQVPIVMSIVTTFATTVTNTNYFNRYMKNILKFALKREEFTTR